MKPRRLFLLCSSCLGLLALALLPTIDAQQPKCTGNIRIQNISQQSQATRYFQQQQLMQQQEMYRRQMEQTRVIQQIQQQPRQITTQRPVSVAQPKQFIQQPIVQTSFVPKQIVTAQSRLLTPQPRPMTTGVTQSVCSPAPVMSQPVAQLVKTSRMLNVPVQTMSMTSRTMSAPSKTINLPQSVAVVNQPKVVTTQSKTMQSIPIALNVKSKEVNVYPVTVQDYKHKTIVQIDMNCAKCHRNDNQNMLTQRIGSMPNPVRRAEPFPQLVARQAPLPILRNPQPVLPTTVRRMPPPGLPWLTPQPGMPVAIARIAPPNLPLILEQLRTPTLIPYGDLGTPRKPLFDSPIVSTAKPTPPAVLPPDLLTQPGDLTLDRPIALTDSSRMADPFVQPAQAVEKRRTPRPLAPVDLLEPPLPALPEYVFVPPAAVQTTAFVEETNIEPLPLDGSSTPDLAPLPPAASDPSVLVQRRAPRPVPVQPLASPTLPPMPESIPGPG